MLNFRDYLNLLRHRWAVVLWCCTICMAIALSFAFGTQATYRSSAVVMIEQSDITASDTPIRSGQQVVDEQQLRLVSRRVMRDDNLSDLVVDLDLYPQLPVKKRPSEVRSNTNLQQVDPVTFDPKSGASAFAIEFDYPDARKARDVAAELAQLFIADNRAVRAQVASEREEFFRSEAEQLLEELSAASDRLADFKIQNQGLLPEDIERNSELLERLREDRFAIQASLRVAQERQNLLAVQRDQLSGGTDLAQLTEELALARQKYSEDHPDVRRLKRAIEALSTSQGGGVANNELRRVSAQLQAIEDEVSAYKRRDDELRARISDLESRLVSAPNVEKELNRLNRELQLANAQYEAIRIRQSEARLGSNLVSQDRGERYTIVREPRVSKLPVYPNRIGIILLGLLCAFGGSAALVALLEAGDPSVRSGHDVVDIVGGPPIATIPLILNSADTGKRRRKMLVHAAGIASVCTIAFLIVSYE